MMWKLLLCLFGLGVLLPTLTLTSPTDTEQINAALDAAENLTQALRNDTFNIVLSVFDATIGPWTVGIDKLFNMMRDPDVTIDNKTMERYITVSEDLGSFLENLVEMKDKIKWEDTSLEYPKIENKIYDLDQKLSQVFETRECRPHTDFVRHYNKGYNLEAIDLWRAVVDGRLLGPVISRRLPIIMVRGLITLMLKGATLEIADQNFQRNERSEVNIWRKRLEKFHLKIKDTIDWQNNFRQEVDTIVKEHSDSDNIHIQKTVYEYMESKYYWRRWGVVGYTYGSMPAYAAYNKTFVYRALVNHKPTFIMVATSDADSDFDVEHAKSVIANPVGSKGCTPGGNIMLCYWLRIPKLGLMSLIVPASFSHRGHPKAMAHGRGSINRKGDGPAYVFYFG